ncbi:MAG: C1 family peptidase [Candidatus Eremiobacteraeota bacterium]|nr:C1 family peptidase [Candidatus Eremiobacteraeota bacterium]
MPNQEFHDRRLDARPDRIDLRDRVYSPRLTSLPSQWPSESDIQTYLPDYRRMILDQGTEGACTGFGLAAVVNYLNWRKDSEGVRSVSPRMFYHLARMYDEWPGEDYDGSSCRGAMKGWHRHGICLEELWPYRNAKGEPEFIPPAAGWQQDAAKRPLGAYYRIEKDSIADLQSAIYEVGAIYVSCRVHEGWRLSSQNQLSSIPFSAQNSGGHAFALVGFNVDGFIVQNSWGPDWGYHGFAVLTYEDWVTNGMDAWVAVLGAPVATSVPATQVDSSLLPGNSSKPSAPIRLRNNLSAVSANPATRPVSEETAFRHSIVMANNGMPINRLVDRANAETALRAVAQEFPLQRLLQQPETNRKIAIYAHGGLNDEPGSIRRVRVMLPYYLANSIYPIFVVWKTGLKETLLNILEDRMGEADGLSAGFFEDMLDRTLEAIAHSAPIRAIWGEMKQNALGGVRPGGALSLLAKNLSELHAQVPGLEIHLIGHSAGSIIHGHLLSNLRTRGEKARSVSLWAPACTVPFANEHYGAAISQGDLGANNFTAEILSWTLEKKDTAGPYHKSLLYLVSRALEDLHKTPILGLQPVWVRNPDPAVEQDLEEICADDQVKAVKDWQTTMGGRGPSVLTDSFSSDGVEQIPTDHGSFDNNVGVLTRSLRKIRGSDLAFPVDCLHDLPAGAFIGAGQASPNSAIK